MSKLPGTNFEIGETHNIDASNADEWAPIIGKPLAKAIKESKYDTPIEGTIVDVNVETGIFTVRVAK